MDSFDDIFELAGKRYNVDPALLKAVMMTESSGNPKAASGAGAVGVMQLMPKTAAAVGVRDRTDPVQSIFGGAQVLAENLDRYGDVPTALMAYHGGTDQRSWGPLTQAYPGKVMGALKSTKMQPNVTQDAVDFATKAFGGSDAKPVDYASAAFGGDDHKAVIAGSPSPSLGNDGNNGPNDGGHGPSGPDPTEGMSGFDKFTAAAGKAVADLGRGTTQLIGIPAQYLESALSGTSLGNTINKAGQALGMPSAAQANANNQAAIDEAKVSDAPLLGTGAGLAGYGAGMLGSTLVPLGVAARGAQALEMPGAANLLTRAINPTTYGAAAGTGAALGALMPEATGDSRLANMAGGAVAGMGGNLLANAIGRIAQPVGNALGAAGSRAAQVLRDAGVPLDAAQQSGSAMLSRIKASLTDNPFTAGAEAEKAATQKSAFNRAILGTIGESADAATPEVMQAAKTRIGNVFDAVAERNPIKYDNELQNALAEIETSARGELEAPQMGVISNKLEEILSKAANGSGEINGKAYQNIKRSLDRISGGQDQSKGNFAREIRGALDDALLRSSQANPGDYDALRMAMSQWGNMRKIEGAIDAEGTGNISPSKLANAMMKKENRNTSIYGNGPQELVSLAQAGKQILPEKLPNSGTTGRAVMQMLTQGGIGGTAGYIGSGGDPVRAAELAAAGIAAPKLLQLMINNPASANYLAQGLNPGMARSVLLAPQTNQLVGALVRHSPRAVISQPR